MANHKSAAKRARSNDRKRIRNRTRMSAMRTAVSNYRETLDQVASGAKVEVGPEVLLRRVQSLVAKAASNGILPAHTASRKISRLTHAFKKVSEVAAEAATATTTKKKKATKKKAAKKKTKTVAKKKSKTKKKSTKKKK